MTKPQRPWIVRPHSKLTQIDDNLSAIEDIMDNKIHRRMTIIKRADGSLIFFNAIPLDDATLTEVRALGTPQFLVLSHDQHMTDAHAFAQKLGLKVYGPHANQEKIKARIDFSGTLEELPKDPSVECFSMPGSKHGETVMVVKSGNGARVSVLVSDVLQNNPQTIPFYFRWLGFAGGPKVVPVYKMMFIADKPLLKKILLEWAAMPGLVRLVPFHGGIVENPAAAIRTAAEKL